MEEEIDPRSILFDAISKTIESILKLRGQDARTILHRANDQFSPDIDVTYLVSKLNNLRIYLENRDKASLEGLEGNLNEFAKRITYWNSNIRQYLYHSAHARQVVLSLLLTIDDIETYLNENSKPIDLKAYQRQLSTIRKSIGSLERNIEDSESKLGDVRGSIKTILEARDAALALPETLDSLRKTDSEISEMHKQVSLFRNSAEKSAEFITEVDEEIRKRQKEIQNVLKQCNDALRASTGVGLAAAFSKHAQTLRVSSRCWVGALIFSFISMVFVGFARINSILEMMKMKDVDASIISLNMILSLFLLAAPVWLAWISAKRISHLFRLIEDYEFKAAISSAYEGYRREAARFEDSNFSERILNSALTRFDEPPLRFVEKNEQVHPFIEFLDILFRRKNQQVNKNKTEIPSEDNNKTNESQEK